MKDEFVAGLLQNLKPVRRWTSVVASRVIRSARQHKRHATVLLLIGALAGTGLGADAQNRSLPPCPDPGMCFVSQAAKDAWAAAQGCSFAEDGTQDEDKSLSVDGEDLLKSIEALALQPYDDQTGKPITQWVKGATIGYGHLISKSEWDLYKNGITEAQAEALFDADLAPYVATVNEAITVTVTQQQFDAMVVLAFNIGRGGFAGSSVVKLVNDPNADTPFDSLEDAWKSWNKSQGVVNQGLINRRNAEWNMYARGVYERW